LSEFLIHQLPLCSTHLLLELIAIIISSEKLRGINSNENALKYTGSTLHEVNNEYTYIPVLIPSLHTSPNIIRVTKPKRMRLMRCAGHVASMVKMKNAYNIRNHEGNRPHGDLNVDRGQTSRMYVGLIHLA
jgi:hypothetical protein